MTENDVRARHLVDEYQTVNALLDSQLPPTQIKIHQGRASSRFQLTRQGIHFTVLVNDRIYRLNDERKILRAFRHMLLHCLQLSMGKRMTHTKQFKQWAKKVGALNDVELKRPEPKYKLLTFVCPTGCQMFRTSDSPNVICIHCGVRMKALWPSQYKQMKTEQRKARQDARKALEAKREKGKH
jgi:predicted SprT family Zn-dependent metalloprotease